MRWRASASLRSASGSDDVPFGPRPDTGAAVDALCAPSGDDDAVSLPPDPQAYDTERSAAARRRGLSTPYIPGGRDPDQARAEAEDRRWVRILLIMVIVIVLAGFVLGMIAVLTGFNGLVGFTD
jgi:hypothetical protein